jgi:hypothetical protein
LNASSQSLRVLHLPLPYVPPLQDDACAPHHHRLRPSPPNDASSPHHPHRPPRRAAMTPAAHNVTPNHRQNIACACTTLPPPPATSCRPAATTPPRHSARSRATTMDEGCRKWKGRPGSGRPTRYAPLCPSPSLTIDTHPLPTASLHGDEELHWRSWSMRAATSP